MNTIVADQPRILLPGREQMTQWLDRALIYCTVILIPYDLPVVHQACIPLTGVAVPAVVTAR